MYTTNDTFTVTDLRHHTTKVFKEALAKGYVYLMRRSKPELALVDINYLKALQETYEDYLDIIEFDKTINLKRISLDKHLKSAKK